MGREQVFFEDEYALPEQEMVASEASFVATSLASSMNEDILILESSLVGYVLLLGGLFFLAVSASYLFFFVFLFVLALFARKLVEERKLALIKKDFEENGIF